LKLTEKQFIFTRDIGKLIDYVYANGYTFTFGDARAKSGHIVNSKHYIGLAVDFNLFYKGKYLSKTEEHLQFGIYWESLGRTWGGRFPTPDGNHYEY
jgi:hypothetical protein